MALQPRFEGSQSGLAGHFDARATPPWLMIPHKSVGWVNLVHAAGMVVRSHPERIAHIDQDLPSGQTRELLINGMQPGRSVIQVVGTNARLDVRVLAERPQSVAFFFVKDRHGDTTTRSQMMTQWIDQLNNVYQRQTSLQFSLEGFMGSLEVETSLRDIVREQDRHLGDFGPEVDKLSWNINVVADINVFFMPPAGADRSLVPRVLADRYKVCLVPDGMSDAEVLVALPHGVGIILGVFPTGDERRKDDLMFDERAEGRKAGFFIPKNDVRVLNYFE